MTAYNGVGGVVDTDTGAISSSLAEFQTAAASIDHVIVQTTATVWVFDDLCFVN